MFVVFILVFSLFISSYTVAYADVSSTIKTEVASILAIGSLLVHGGFTFTSRDSLFAFSKKIYDTLDSVSLSNLQTFVNGYKALSSLPYNTIKAIYDLAKSYLTSSSIDESLVDAVSISSGSTYQIFSSLEVLYSNTNYMNQTINWDSKYTVDGMNVDVVDYKNGSLYDNYTFASPPSGAASMNFFINYTSSSPYCYVQYFDSNGNLLSSTSNSFTGTINSISVVNGTIYNDVTINPSQDVVFPSSVDTDSVANSISTGQAGSISAPVYAPDLPSDNTISDVLNTNLDILLKTTSSLVDTNVQTLSAVKSISVTLSDVLSSVKSIASSLTDGLVGDLSQVNFQPVLATYTDLSQKFPFSIPWDISRVISILNVPVQAPSFQVSFPDFKGGYAVYNVDISWLNTYINVIRTLEVIVFDIMLIVVSRKLSNPGE